MQMLDLEKLKNKIKKKNYKLKKSQLCILGSLLAIIGMFLLSANHIKKLKDDVFSKMQLSMIDNSNDIDIVVEDVPDVKEKEKKNKSVEKKEKEIDYSKYTGVLEIPRISLKRGFYNVGHRYNDIEHNVTVISGSSMPDVVNGNLMLMAHSGDAYISFFAFLHRLQIGDLAYVSYNGTKYKYQIVNIYNIPKNGSLTVTRNMERTTLTMVTCTKDSETEQTVYIAEQI